MANFFEKVKVNAKNVEEKFIGPDYKYFNFIKSPEELGMSASGSVSALTNDIAGLIGYVALLSSGNSDASKTGKPLGNKFFLETGATCEDVATGETVTRSLYVNNVPDGSIPFITTTTGASMPGLYGLIPGTLSNLSQINPIQMFGAFMEGPNPKCQSIKMETISVNNDKSFETAWVTTNDIANMNATWFPGGVKPTINKEAFTLLGGAKSNMSNKYKSNKYKKDYSIMPYDGLVKVYYSSLTLLVFYIFYKLFQKKG